jgi:hypothetical protein
MMEVAEGLARLRRNQPSGPLLTADAKEAIERELAAFDNDDALTVLRFTRLYDSNGKAVWPPPEWEAAPAA